MPAESLARQILRDQLVEGELEPCAAIGIAADQTLPQYPTGTMAFMLFGKLGADSVHVRGGKGRVYEFTGPGVDTLSVPERGTIANMIAELGATSALFPPDERTPEWLRLQDREDDMRELAPDAGCPYDERVEIDLSALGPLVARPPSPDDVVGVDEVSGTPGSRQVQAALVRDDDLSTGDLAPDGVEVMAYGSDVPAIAEFTLRARDLEFRTRIRDGAERITARVDGERELTVRHDFTDTERAVLLCGGLLAYLSGRGEGPASASGGAGRGTGPQREEREGVGGRAE